MQIGPKDALSFAVNALRFQREFSHRYLGSRLEFCNDRSEAWPLSTASVVSSGLQLTLVYFPFQYTLNMVLARKRLYTIF